jgi:hypothetical protein
MSLQQVLLGAGGAGRVTASYTYATNTAYSYLALNSLSGYVAGRTDITVTINSGVYVYGPVIPYVSTQYPGIEIVGGTTGDTVTIVNNGFILGAGGCGQNSYDPKQKFGYPAIIFSSTVNSYTINNTNASAYIAGGGGVGGETSGSSAYAGGGGGAGGGIGGNTTTLFCCCGSIVGYVSYGGLGGGPGSTGAAGVYNTGGYSAGGGGRILPGTGGGQSAGGGSGGGGGHAGGSSGGTGGSGSAVGGNSTGGTSAALGGGGGGWGAIGGTASGFVGNTNISPGNGGKAVNLNGKTVTWVSGDTTRVYGAVS